MTKHKILLLFLLMILPLPVRDVLADTGPKPSMEFSLNQELGDEQVTITAGTLYECDQADCSDASPLQELGPQGLHCDAQSCNAVAYGFAPYHRLELEFSDGKTRQSNIFETAGFDSEYTVIVRPNELLVESNSSPTTMFPRAVTVILLCACVLAAGALAIGVIVFVLRRRAKS